MHTCFWTWVIEVARGDSTNNSSPPVSRRDFLKLIAAAGNPNLAAFSTLDFGTAAWQANKSELSSRGSFFQKKFASEMLLWDGSGSWYSQTQPKTT
jgi:hypothetical protein